MIPLVRAPRRFSAAKAKIMFDIFSFNGRYKQARPFKPFLLSKKAGMVGVSIYWPSKSNDRLKKILGVCKLNYSNFYNLDFTIS